MAEKPAHCRQQHVNPLGERVERPGAGSLVRWYDAQSDSLRISRVGEQCPRCGGHSLDVFVPPGDCDMGFGCCRCDWIGGRVAKFPYERATESGERRGPTGPQDRARPDSD